MSRGKHSERLSETLNERLVAQARSELPIVLAQMGTTLEGLSEDQVESLLVQERRSNKAALALNERVSNSAHVRRLGTADLPDADGGLQTVGLTEIPIKQLVPGDIVILSAGDMIPADCRILSATDLFLGQSAMTGETLPVEKFPDARSESGSALEMANIVFMGTNVISGSATAVVLATGNNTYFGTLARRVRHTDINGNDSDEVLEFAYLNSHFMTLLVVAAGIFVPMGPLAEYFKLQALPLVYFAWLGGIVLSYALLTALMKRYFIRRFGWQ